MRFEQRLRESVGRHGALAAVVTQRGRHSYAELDLKSERLAAALQAGGVTRGARVVLFMEDGWEAVVSLFAVLKAGGVLMPVATAATASEFHAILHQDQPVAVLTQSRLAAMVAASIASVWSVRLIVLAGGDRARSGGTCISFEEVVGGIGRVAPLADAGNDSDPAVLIAGEAPLTHRQLGEDAAGAAISGDGTMLPALAERAGLSRLLAVVEAGGTMIVRSPSVRADDAGQRIVDLRPAPPPFGMSRRFDAAVAGGSARFAEVNKAAG